MIKRWSNVYFFNQNIILSVNYSKLIQEEHFILIIFKPIKLINHRVIVKTEYLINNKKHDINLHRRKIKKKKIIDITCAFLMKSETFFFFKKKIKNKFLTFFFMFKHFRES